MSGSRRKNYRMASRVPVYLPASYELGPEGGEGTVLQISEGGMLFSCPEEIEVRAKGVFSLKAFDDEPELTVDGEVIHRLYESDPPEDGHIKYGVRFVEPEKDQQDVISRVIRFATIRERYFTGPVTES